MGDAAVDPDIIKRTQDTLGQVINAPALTEKLLSRPPVQFLQDIVKGVVKKTDFLQGLYNDEELTPAYLKESRDNKTLFMKKLVTAVYIAVKRAPDVRVSKILAGQEADKTNLLLQALAEAINANVDNREVVRKTLQSLGESNENEEPARNQDQEQSDKRSSKGERSSKSRDREEPTPEKKSSSRDHSKDKGDADGSGHSKKRRGSRAPEDNAHEEKKPTIIQRQDDDDDNDKRDDDESKGRRPIRPTSAKGTRKHQDNGSHQRATSPKTEQPSRHPPTLVSNDRDDNDGPLVRPTTAAKRNKLVTQTSSDEMAGTSGRTPSGAQRGQGTLIIESTKTRDNDVNNDNDDDDDDNFLIQEEKPSATKSFKQDDFDSRDGGTGDQDDDDGAQHGALVTKMMNSKKNLEHGSEIAGQKADVKTITQNDAQRRREREKIQKDVDKLRETIQSLTKSVVPLGKILEYLQEDYEMMAKEMQHYTDEYKRTIVDLRKEKFTTDQSLEPLRAALLDFDDQIGDMKNRIIFMKKKINTTEKANGERLLKIIGKIK
ncbi:unnamed protein product [Adineta steineri]|uniref:TRAF3-interacting protein 1 n=1 Tax=Adineta steineri TaxID=433720 RepID=A0A813S0F4_9BILA|nr:unnamed protein product [Adineta steineri]CAF0792938.1 unnamed protein product [Adineta steineri]CAF0797080.1 unnamed protein product [Adineta steineri]